MWSLIFREKWPRCGPFWAPTNRDLVAPGVPKTGPLGTPFGGLSALDCGHFTWPFCMAILHAQNGTPKNLPKNPGDPNKRLSRPNYEPHHCDSGRNGLKPVIEGSFFSWSPSDRRLQNVLQLVTKKCQKMPFLGSILGVFCLQYGHMELI